MLETQLLSKGQGCNRPVPASHPVSARAAVVVDRADGSNMPLHIEVARRTFVVACDIIEHIRMVALVRIGDIVMTIMTDVRLTLACLRSALNIMVLAALGSFAQVTPVTAVVVTARIAVTIIHC